MNKGSGEFKKLVYDLMNGSLDLEKYAVLESRYVKDEFAEGMPCDLLYKNIFNANRRLCNRLQVEEDQDVEEIITDLLSISEYLSMKMYDYCMLFSSDYY